MITKGKLVLLSLRHHARQHLGVLMGTAVGAAVLVGALLVGDSVRGSLRDMALARIGKAQVALVSNDRLFGADLEGPLSEALNAPSASALLFPGTASADGGKTRANRVQVLGVGSTFWDLRPNDVSPQPALPGEGEVLLNSYLASQLGVSEGQELLLRVPKPTLLSRDAPMAPEEDAMVALRVTVKGVVGDDQYGRFGLQANQLPPFNAYLNREWFQEQLESSGRANLLLVGPSKDGVAGPDPDQVEQAVSQVWRLEDAELSLAVPEAAPEVLELRTSRVFLDDPVMEAITHLAQDTSLQIPGLQTPQKVLTYFVNRLTHGDKLTPYSMVTATESPVLPADMKPDEMMVIPWLAEDLGVQAGDEVTLSYYVVGTGRKLDEHSHTFKVRGVLLAEGQAGDPTLMPDFPGMADAKNCREWDTGFPMDLDLIREDKDNGYWQEKKGAPKAFIPIATGQSIWGNRFGNLTALRFPGAAGAREKLEAALLKQLSPAAVGLVPVAVREDALRAVGQSQDFGGLFIGFSFFLIVAALLLTSMLFQFGLENRTRELGTLKAVGFTARNLRCLMMGEGFLIALIGTAIGALGGVAYARAMLLGLTTLWRDAVGTSSLTYHASGATVAAGVVGALLTAMLTLYFSLRRMVTRPARELLFSSGEGGGTTDVSKRSWRRNRNLGWGCLLLAGLLSFTSGGAGSAAAAGAFFGAGSLLLVSGLSFSSFFLRGWALAEGQGLPSLSGVAVRNASRRRRRSLGTIAMLACGTFLVVAVGANKMDATKNAESRSSGTGGFAFFGESTLPVIHDLSTPAGLDFFGLDPEDLQGVSVISMKLRGGDDASCLNLNRAQQPRLLGVDPTPLKERSAFTFAGVMKGLSPDEGWGLLDHVLEDGAVPAIADQNSILWALGKKVGDTLEYVDELGRPLQVRLVAGLGGSILQGYVVISDRHFAIKYPNETGYRSFLIDADPAVRSERAKTLSRALSDEGLELQPAVVRLDQLNAVQNTYLSTFQLLGGLGLLLGSFGLGVVVLRNVLERRSELAVLRAVGFAARRIRWMLFVEHGLLLAMGLFIGVMAAGLAVLPALMAPGADVPYQSLGMTLAGVALSGLVWTAWACRSALKGNLLDALRKE